MQLNQYANYLINVFSEKDIQSSDQEGMRVNPIVSELATWYEKLRNAMDYRDDEVVLRAAIERILKRRHFYGGNGKTIATPLLRELTWARYFPDGSMTEKKVNDVEAIINLYLSLRKNVLASHKIDENELNTIMYHLISSHLTYFLNPNIKRETMSNFVFHIMKGAIQLVDDSESTKDVQVFIATRRAFAKDDLALLHYHLFTQYYGQLSTNNIQHVSDTFMTGYAEIREHLRFSLRHKIYGYVSRNMPPFFILEELLIRNQSKLDTLVKDPGLLELEIQQICAEKYAAIRSKVNRAVIRSLVFLILTKTVVALSVEGTFESIVYGEIYWTNIILNIVIPPILLGVASVFIKTPGTQNTDEIIQRIKNLLFAKNPLPSQAISIGQSSKKKRSAIYVVFSILWIFAFIASFGLVIGFLNLLQFNFISQAIFVFFLAIVSFLIYRIHQTAKTYTVLRKQTIVTPLVDFLFLPIARVGRYITEGVSQVNVFLIALDLIIEAPFKGLFSFFEQWFMFLHAKREYLE